MFYREKEMFSKHLRWLDVVAVAALLATPAVGESPKKGAVLSTVPFPDVQIRDAFWSPRLDTNRKATIEANLRQCEIIGCMQNFAVAGELRQGKFKGIPFNDIFLYRAIEAVAYTLADKPDADLEKRADAIIDLIAAAQQSDGYLNTYVTLVKPKERWRNVRFLHELCTAGHLFEAAVAYHHATGKRKLLDVAIKLADYIGSVFGPNGRLETSGHEEIELALVRLYQVTNEKKYLKLAEFFLDIRGQAGKRRLYGEYAQDHKPLREQREAVGHAVRAMFLYTAMADVAALTGDQGLFQAMDAIWHDIVERKMYITGGIGPSAHNEGFTVPYDLPNETAYCETCATCGMAIWNHRLFLLTGEGKYADVLERCVYNGLLSGVSLSGDRFNYVNPLASSGHHHRQPWFPCPCCPPNVARYIPAMGERVYAHRGNAIWTVLYMGNTAVVPLDGGKVKLSQKTNYPWDGHVQITVEPEKTFPFDLRLRIPGWCSRPAGQSGLYRAAGLPIRASREGDRLHQRPGRGRPDARQRFPYHLTSLEGRRCRSALLADAD